MTPSKTTEKRVLTTRHIQDLFPKYLQEIGALYRNRPDLVLAAWPEVIGPQLAPMTQALSFVDGVLKVKVKNSTLHSLLAQIEYPRLIKNLRDRFPTTEIKKILFFLG